MLCNESVDQSTGDMPRGEWISFADFRLGVRGRHKGCQGQGEWQCLKYTGREVIEEGAASQLHVDCWGSP